MKHIKLFEAYINESSSTLKTIEKAIPGVKFEEQEIEFDPEEGYKSVESFSTNVPGISGDYGEDDLYINIYDGKEFCFFYDSAPIATSLHTDSERNMMAQTQMEDSKPLSKLNKAIFDEVVKSVKNEMGVKENVNEAENSSVKPNAKLKSDTGFPYAMFYLSTQAANIMIDFENPKHISVIGLLADQDRELEKNGELSPSSIRKGRELFKKALGENVSYSKYDGADCTFRLSSTPDVDLNAGKKDWFGSFLAKRTGKGSVGGEGIGMEKYILR